MNTMIYLHRAFISLCGGAGAPPHPRLGYLADNPLTSQVDYKLDECSPVTPGGGVGELAPPLVYDSPFLQTGNLKQ